jgi:hypothetical protein
VQLPIASTPAAPEESSTLAVARRTLVLVRNVLIAGFGAGFCSPESAYIATRAVPSWAIVCGAILTEALA